MSERRGDASGRALALFVVLNRAYAAITARVCSDIRGRGFDNPTEWAVLELLYHKGPQTLSAVGQKILIANASVTYVVDKLEAAGLIERRPCSEDRRIKYAAITEKGRSLMEREFPDHAEAIRELMAELSPDEQETLHALLKRLGLAAGRT